MRDYFIYIFIALLSFSANAQKNLDAVLKKHNKNEIPYISVTELRMLQSQGKVLIVDSREQKEFNVSHLIEAKNVGFDFFSTEKFLEDYPDKNTPIVVYCTLGIRSEIIADKLIRAGYTNVKNLYGGICQWKNKSFKVIDSVNTETENIHTFNKQWSKWLVKGVKVY